MAKNPVNLGPPVNQRVREFWFVWNGQTGAVRKTDISERDPVFRFRTRESTEMGSQSTRVVTNPLNFGGFDDAHEKTPSTLALGVLC